MQLLKPSVLIVIPVAAKIPKDEALPSVIGPAAFVGEPAEINMDATNAKRALKKVMGRMVRKNNRFI